jgi:hypothetical protein
MSKLERLINQLNEEVDNEFDNFDPTAEFFDPEQYDADMIRAGGLRSVPRVMSNANVRRINTGIGRGYAANVPTRGESALAFPNSVTKAANKYTGDYAQFDVKIERLTNNISAALPVAVFGALADANNYQQTLTPLLPPNVILTITREDAAYRFRYTDQITLNVDQILVTCQQTPYPALVRASQFDILKVAGIRYSLSNSSNVAQYQNSLVIDERSIFGAKKQNELTPTSYVSPDQFQSGIVDIPQAFDTDKETTLITLIGDFSPFSVNLSMFVAKWTKYNAKTIL